MWTDPVLKSGISVRKLISIKKEEKRRERAQAGIEWLEHSPKILTCEERATTTTTTKYMVYC